MPDIQLPVKPREVLGKKVAALRRQGVTPAHVSGPHLGSKGLRGVQRDPVTSKILHVDFYQVSLTQKMRSEVRLVLVGEAPAVGELGGVLLQSVDSIMVEALPGDIPAHVEVDVSALARFDDAVHVRDLAIDLSKVHVITE